MSSIPSAHGVDHFAFTVPHLSDAIAFFCEALGAELVYELGPIHDPCGQRMRRQFGVHEQAVATVAMLRLGPVTNVELFEYQVPGEQAPPPRHGDWGSHHLGFCVADLDAAVSYLEGLAGVQLLGRPVSLPGGPDPRPPFVYFTTPMGLLMKVAAQSGHEGQPDARGFGAGAEWPPDHRGIPTARTVVRLGLTVPDLPTAERFFCEYLGAELVSRLGPTWLDARFMAGLAVRTAGVLQQSLLHFGPTSSIELLQFEIPGQRHLPPANSDHGGHHLAFAVSDVDQAAAYLNSLHGMKPLGTPQTEQEGAITGTRWQYFRTPWGLHVEVIDRPPGVPLGRTATAARLASGTAVLS